jgi:hypothetical protein
VTAPALFAVARDDRYVTPSDMRTLARRSRSPAERVIALPASAGHGWEMLLGTTSEFSPLAATVAAFIRRHAAAPVPPLEKCPDADWRPLPTAGIYSPTAARLSRGRVAVVFANDSDNVTCAWSAEARSLAAQGYAVAVFETAGNWTNEYRQVVSVAHALRRTGVRRFALIGASVGARAVLQAAAEHPGGVAGVVPLSAERRRREPGRPALRRPPGARAHVVDRLARGRVHGLRQGHGRLASHDPRRPRAAPEWRPPWRRAARRAASARGDPRLPAQDPRIQGWSRGAAFRRMTTERVTPAGGGR